MCTLRWKWKYANDLQNRNLYFAKWRYACDLQNINFYSGNH